MQKDRVRIYKHVRVLSVLAGLTIMTATAPAWAVDSVPVPAHKPSIEKKAEIVRYSLKDFAKALLDFGDQPAASAKPPAGYEGPLSAQDAERYSRIFTLQEAGKIKEADKEMAALQDWRLRGHVLYQRYMHPTAYKSSHEELRNWLALYNDHPGASKIYALASRKGGEGDNKPRPPRRPEKPFVVDPDSPFAALAALKFRK